MSTQFKVSQITVKGRLLIF